MASTKIAFYIYYLLIISPGIHVYVYYMVFAKLLKLLKKCFLERFHMGTLGTKTSQWRPVHVPYLPYPRYATAHQYFVTEEHILSQKNAMSEMEFDPGTALQATALPTELRKISTNAVSRGGYEPTFCTTVPI
jgi:hypothetical protein